MGGAIPGTPAIRRLKESHRPAALDGGIEPVGIARIDREGSDPLRCRSGGGFVGGFAVVAGQSDALDRSGIREDELPSLPRVVTPPQPGRAGIEGVRRSRIKGKEPDPPPEVEYPPAG